jgi:hypothetical protein
MLSFAIGCSSANSPTSPTPTQTQPPTQSGPTVLQVNWNVTAQSCGPVPAPPAQPAFADATIVKRGDTGFVAAWPYQSGRLYATFVLENNTWALCSWDVADV